MAAQIQKEPVVREVKIPTSGRRLSGTLHLPPGATAIVLFAHGSGSGRFSPRNQLVAQRLQAAGLGTLLFGLLDEEESEDRRKVFDIELLSERLLCATLWLRHEPATQGLRIGYFGASTGASAALVAASHHPELADAIVSRGGRPDLARADLPGVRTPTLLIVGGLDTDVLALNRQALALLRCPREMVIVPGASHLFPEAGAMDEVARLACEWFLKHLAGDAPASRPPPMAAAGRAQGEAGERFPRADMDPEC